VGMERTVNRQSARTAYTIDNSHEELYV